MADFFAPMSDIQGDVMRPIDPLLLVEDGYQRGAYQVGLGLFDVDMMGDMGPQTLGIAPIDPMYPSDVFTPTENIFGHGTGHQASARLGGFTDAMDVFNMARFLFEGR